jgi:hypothetical protein
VVVGLPGATEREVVDGVTVKPFEESVEINTLPENPLILATLKVAVGELFCVVSSSGGVNEMLKSGLGRFVTFTGIVRVCLSGPLVPVTMTL